MATAAPHTSDLPLRLAHRPALALLWTATLVVIGLGVLQEWFVYTYGTDTLLEDLGQIALDAENCLGAWYSSLLMVAATVLLAAISESPAPDIRPWRNHWRVLAVIFIALSIDETVSFHEVLIDPLRLTFGWSGALHFAWIVPAAILCLVAGIAYLRFVIALPRRLRAQIVLAGALYVGGALGFEAVGGQCYTSAGPDSFCYIAAATVEEVLEIFGLTVFVAALFGHLQRRYDTISVELAGPQR